MSDLSFDPCPVKPDRPCLSEVVERHEGVTVEVLRCRRCGRRSIQWMRPEIAALAEEMEHQAEGTTKTAAEEPKPRRYWDGAESWLRELQKYNVSAVAMIALVDDEDVSNITVTYDTGPFEIAMMAGILQMIANKKYCDMNDDDREEDDDEG